MRGEAISRGGGNAARRRRAGLALALAGAVALAVPLAGCGGATRLASLPTPPDPPPIPDRKPLIPDWAGLAGGAAEAAGSGAAQAAQAAVQAGAKLSPAAPAPVRKVSLAPLSPAKPVEAPAMPAASPLGGQPMVRYRVELGDTVYGVSRRRGVPIRDVIEANGLTPPFTLKVGQVLLIPSPRRHVVRPGDTVYGIARRYGVDLTELVRFNGIAPPYTISPGQDLVLPTMAGPAAATPGRVATAASDSGAAASPGTAAPGGTQTAALPSLAPPPAPKIPQAIPAPPPRSGGKFLWPLRGRVIDGYGSKDGGLHNDGINIAAPRGTPVRAADNGVVAYAGNELRGFGNLVLIKHSGGWVTAYAHTDEILVRRGAVVTRGQVIARTGNSGNVSQPQLHFEIRQGTRAVDPLRFLGPPQNALAAD